jgi:large subunit ribosomal protein L13
MKSFQARPGQVEQQWHLVDAEDRVLGRLACQVATILTGKHRPTYTPHTDTGDYVVVLNAAKVKLTGKKRQAKTYQSYSGYPGGQKTVGLEQLLERHPDRVIRRAVRCMMPKNRLARRMLKKLKIYPGPEHPHQAQCPRPLELTCQGVKQA